jgi:hypothetical protein
LKLVPNAEATHRVRAKRKRQNNRLVVVRRLRKRMKINNPRWTMVENKMRICLIAMKGFLTLKGQRSP